MYKGSRFLVPQVLRVWLLKALHMGPPRVQSMVLRAKETFWWPGLKEDIIQVRAICQMCHQNAPSQQKEPSMGVPISQYAFESISVDHFFLKGNEFLTLVDRHSGMMSCHSTHLRGSREFLKILRLHCQRNGIPRELCSDGSSIFMSHETQDFFTHRVSSVANPHSNKLKMHPSRLCFRDRMFG